jgi:hypothetical protein
VELQRSVRYVLFCSVVLCCVMSCYDIICCVLSRYVVLCCVMLCCVMLCCVMLCFVTLNKGEFFVRITLRYSDSLLKLPLESFKHVSVISALRTLLIQQPSNCSDLQTHFNQIDPHRHGSRRLSWKCTRECPIDLVTLLYFHSI